MVKDGQHICSASVLLTSSCGQELEHTGCWYECVTTMAFS